MPATFVFLVLSICAVWMPAVRFGPRLRLPPWIAVYAVAVLAALVQGFLQAAGVATLIVLLGLAFAAHRTTSKGLYWLVFALLVMLCAALLLHKAPGFNNPIVINAEQISSDAKPYTQYLNFDKGSVGLILLALASPRLRRDDHGRSFVVETAIGYALTCAVVFGAATAAGVVHLDLKVPMQTLLFAVTNIFLVCVAEEAFFRNLVQDPLLGRRITRNSDHIEPSRLRVGIAVAVSATLFGLAHAAGGSWAISMAMTLAGLGYAVVYARTNRIEAPILVHFGLNVTHFLAFTYPALKG